MCVHFLLIAVGIDAVCADLLSGSFSQGQFCVILTAWFNPSQQPNTTVLLTASLTTTLLWGGRRIPTATELVGMKAAIRTA